MTDQTVIPAGLRAAVSRSSFYQGMRVLPSAERNAMFAVYAFCRAVDDIADDLDGTRPARRAALDQWRADIDALYAGRDPGLAGLLSDAVTRFHLDQADLIAVIDGMQMDVDADIRWPVMEVLELYCDRVAVAVGRLSVAIFGMAAEPGAALAHHLGRALQYTNILRDIDEDAAMGRVYLPAEPLLASGIVFTDPVTVTNDRRIEAACRALAALARDHFTQASAILALRPAGHLIAPRLMGIAYERVLARMERTGWAAPRTRARVGKLRLIGTMIRLQLGR